MDCGAGTYEQFMYHYTPEELPKKLLNLKVIFMTHLHADHTLGILDIIHQRNQIMKTQFPDRDDKVFLVLPFNMFNWVYYYSKTVQPILEGSC
jgi:ribonuclease Z